MENVGGENLWVLPNIPKRQSVRVIGIPPLLSKYVPQQVLSVPAAVPILSFERLVLDVVVRSLTTSLNDMKEREALEKKCSVFNGKQKSLVRPISKTLRG